ncbi:MAG: heat-inducible transcriptional repressor HrcA [Lachnospiraceae bacterium]|nr:heat-inducible transcriptional repressor HrcA [Lachnospiraceae bacterium]
MELDERKIKILDTIIRTYLETGEPVGSRTISKYTDLNLSSATIRNEMSDLEELGYIIQPHTSAGRIPSDKGYRFYVDHLMQAKDKEISDMKDFVIEHTERIDSVLKQLAQILSYTTNYATLITSQVNRDNAIKFVQISKVDEDQLLAVVVMGKNVVKNKVINLVEPIDNETLMKLNFILNNGLNGKSPADISLGVISGLKEQAGEHVDIVSVVLDAIAETISQEDLEVYTSGATNIFKYPELSSSENASNLIYALEEKKELAEFVSENFDGDDEIKVYIGDESDIKTMKDCSVVTATYDLGDGMKGTVGIIGPKRMDYEKVMSNLKEIKKQMSGLFNSNKTKGIEVKSDG